jgi:hypothetical protein
MPIRQSIQSSPVLRCFRPVEQLRTGFTFDRDGNAVRVSYAEEKQLRPTPTEKILLVTNLGPNRFRIGSTTGSPNDPSDVIDVVYSLEGDNLSIIGSRRRSGEVIVENGVSRLTYSRLSPRHRCADARAAQSNLLVATPYVQKADNRPDVPGLPPFQVTQVGVQCYALTILPTDSIQIEIAIPRIQVPRLQYDHWVDHVLQIGESAGKQHCHNNGVSIDSLQRSRITATVLTREQNVEYFLSAEKQPGQAWIVRNNTVKAMAAAQAREAAILAERRKLAADFGVSAWPSRTALIANPFSMKTQVVGFYGVFLRMVAESEALFGGPGCPMVGCADAVVVSGVGSARFQVPNEEELLVVRVKGIRPNGGGPELEYIAAMPCYSNGCATYGKFSSDGSLIGQ